MKPGKTFCISSDSMMVPWIGHLVTVTLPGGEEPVKARVTDVTDGFVTLKAVSEDTKE